MRIVWLSVFIVIVDQITKLLVKGISIPVLSLQVEGIALGNSRPILGDFVRLTYIENPGMAFGIDFGGKLFFSLFTIIASIGIAIYLHKMRNEPFPFRFSLAMILGGACGNLIDRVFYGVLYGDAPLLHGSVVDFIDVDFFNINFLGYHLSRWPVFNVADASVSIGVILLLFSHQRSGRTVPPVKATATMCEGSSGSRSTENLRALSKQEIDPPESSPQP